MFTWTVRIIVTNMPCRRRKIQFVKWKFLKISNRFGFSSRAFHCLNKSLQTLPRLSYHGNLRCIAMRAFNLIADDNKIACTFYFVNSSFDFLINSLVLNHQLCWTLMRILISISHDFIPYSNYMFRLGDKICSCLLFYSPSSTNSDADIHFLVLCFFREFSGDIRRQRCLEY